MKPKTSHHYNAPKSIFDNARALRKNATPAETRLWKILRNRKLLSFKFRRQHPVYFFVADFYCHELKLVIEVDGDIHLLNDVKEYDKDREEKIKELGLTVIRFTNEQVLFEPEIIERTILEYISKSKIPEPSP